MKKKEQGDGKKSEKNKKVKGITGKWKRRGLRDDKEKRKLKWITKMREEVISRISNLMDSWEETGNN